MAFITLQDLSGSCELVVFPELYEKANELIKQDALIFVRGRINSRDDIPKVLAEELVDMNEVKKKFTRFISIQLQTAGLEPKFLKEIQSVLSSHRGKTPVYLAFRDPSGKSAVVDSGQEYRVQTSDELLKSLENLVGENSIKIG